MFWECSWDQNNIINNKHYSEYAFQLVSEGTITTPVTNPPPTQGPATNPPPTQAPVTNPPLITTQAPPPPTTSTSTGKLLSKNNVTKKHDSHEETFPQTHSCIRHTR